MAALRRLLISVLFVLTLMSWSQSLPATLDNPDEDREKNQSLAPLNRNKRAVGLLGILGLSLSVGSAIQAGICTFSSICGNDPLPEMLEQLNNKLDVIGESISSLQSDVADIWQESKRSWYFDQITYVRHLRIEVLQIPQEAGQRNNFQELKLQRFIDEVLGENGNDKNVLEALYNIPRLVTDEGLIEHYLSNQKRKVPDNKREAIKRTWKLIKNIFELQNDGYASVLLAYGFKYKTEQNAARVRKEIVRCTRYDSRYKRFLDKYTGKKSCFNFDKIRRKLTHHATRVLECDKNKRMVVDINAKLEAYQHAVSEVCSLWKSADEQFSAECSELIDQPHLKDRRKPQKDHIFSIIELFQYPALQVNINCRDDGTEGLALAAIGEKSNELWGYHRENSQLKKMDRSSETVTSVPMPEDCAPEQSQGACYPFDVSVSGRTSDDFRIAVAAAPFSGQQNSEKYLLLYRQTEDGLELVCKKNVPISSAGGLKSVVVCGDFFGYQTQMGEINLYNLDCSNLDSPARTWSLIINFEHDYLRCSNDGTKLLVESNVDFNHDEDIYFWGAAAINVNEGGSTSDLSTLENVQSEAEIVLKRRDLPWQDNKERLQKMAGMGFDSQENFFVSSSASGSYLTGTTGSRVGGVYQRLSDGTFRIIREYPRDDNVVFEDLAIDEDSLYTEERMWIDNQQFGPKCVHEYQPDLDFENVILDWTDEQ